MPVLSLLILSRFKELLVQNMSSEQVHFLTSNYIAQQNFKARTKPIFSNCNFHAEDNAVCCFSLSTSSFRGTRMPIFDHQLKLYFQNTHFYHKQTVVISIICLEECSWNLPLQCIRFTRGLNQYSKSSPQLRENIFVTSNKAFKTARWHWWELMSEMSNRVLHGIHDYPSNDYSNFLWSSYFNMP